LRVGRQRRIEETPNEPLKASDEASKSIALRTIAFQHFSPRDSSVFTPLFLDFLQHYIGKLSTHFQRE
jgi:hypothetical protein